MSGYILKGHLSAQLIRNFTECLDSVTVKIYRPPLTVENDDVFVPKNSVQCLTPKEVRTKEASLIGESKTDAKGNYCVQLFEGYDGEAIEVDVKIEKVPYQKNDTKNGPQVTLRKFTPIWRKKDAGWYYIFDCCIPFEFWSGIRLQCDAWLIFGYVKTSSQAKDPLAEVSVTAYDFDWDKDDELGTAITDATGFFRIDYARKDFTKTILSPLINIETPISLMSGPGVYFKITDTNGQLLHKESRDTGCGETRKNAHHCFYADVFVDMDAIEKETTTDEN